MDIKLKNRHRISALLSFLIVVAAAVIMTGLYPFLKKRRDAMSSPHMKTRRFYATSSLATTCWI